MKTYKLCALAIFFWPGQAKAMEQAEQLIHTLPTNQPLSIKPTTSRIGDIKFNVTVGADKADLIVSSLYDADSSGFQQIKPAHGDSIIFSMQIKAPGEYYEKPTILNDTFKSSNPSLFNTINSFYGNKPPSASEIIVTSNSLESTECTILLKLHYYKKGSHYISTTFNCTIPAPLREQPRYFFANDENAQFIKNVHCAVPPIMEALCNHLRNNPHFSIHTLDHVRNVEQQHREAAHARFKQLLDQQISVTKGLYTDFSNAMQEYYDLEKPFLQGATPTLLLLEPKAPLPNGFCLHVQIDQQERKILEQVSSEIAPILQKNNFCSPYIRILPVKNGDGLMVASPVFGSFQTRYAYGYYTYQSQCSPNSEWKEILKEAYKEFLNAFLDDRIAWHVEEKTYGVPTHVNGISTNDLQAIPTQFRFWYNDLSTLDQAAQSIASAKAKEKTAVHKKAIPLVYMDFDQQPNPKEGSAEPEISSPIPPKQTTKSFLRSPYLWGAVAIAGAATAVLYYVQKNSAEDAD